MNKMLFSIPDQPAARMKASIPQRQRSKVIALLIEQEVERREKILFECAAAVEKDSRIQDEMKDWDIASQDGLEDESW